MSFYKRDMQTQEKITRKCHLDFSNEECVTEQSHEPDCNINNIVRKHGMDLIAQTAQLQNFTYDDNPNNDFQETMNAILKAKDSFSQVPSDIRKQFDNDPAKFLDFIHNPANQTKLVEMGLANPPKVDNPVKVEITNPTPQTSQESPQD